MNARSTNAAILCHAILSTLRRWLDSSSSRLDDSREHGAIDRIDWLRVAPFVLLHLACVAVLWVGVSTTAVIVTLTLYVLRMFAVTGFYHRYFSHRAFKTSRIGQFVFAVLGASAVQRGPIWWAAHHRHHHAYSDQPEDVHSPRQRGFIWSHAGWFLSKRHFAPDLSRVRDLLRYPELRLIDRYDVLVPIALAAALWLMGTALEIWAPQLETERLATARMGLLCFNRGLLSRDLYDQFAVSSLRSPTLCDERR